MGSSEKCGAAAGARLAVLGCWGLCSAVVCCGVVWWCGVVVVKNILTTPVIINCLPIYLRKQLIL